MKENDKPSDIMVTFDPKISEEAIAELLKALSDFYRACGGGGFSWEFEIERKAN